MKRMEWWYRIDEGCDGEGGKEEEERIRVGGGVRWGGVMLGYASIQGGVRRNLRLVVEVMRGKEIRVMGLGETDMKGRGLGMSVEGI